MNEVSFWRFVIVLAWSSTIRLCFIILQTQEPEFITICPFGKYFGIRDKRKLRIWHVPEKDSERIEIKKMRLHHTKTLTILAFHSTKRIVAAGDVTGRILVWRGFGNRAFSLSNRLKNGRLMTYEDERAGVRGDDDADSCTTWHWHSSEVKLLLFSSDGAYLYSGIQKLFFILSFFMVNCKFAMMQSIM